MKKSIVIIIFFCTTLISTIAKDLGKDNNSTSSSTSGFIRVYFNNPVDTSVATGEKAGYLHYAIDDTLIAYINRAKYTIDIAIYSFEFQIKSNGAREQRKLIINIFDCLIMQIFTSKSI